MSTQAGHSADAYRPDRMVRIPVVGGELAVGVWGSGEPVTLAVHGITGSHRSWALVAEWTRGNGTFVAPDLRGRGASNELPGPYGLGLHVQDCLAVLDAFDAGTATVLGHSMGAFVSVVLAADFAERVRRLVLVDGGPPLGRPPGDTIDEQLATMIGPAAKRLEMRFASVRAHHDFWQAHPALADWHPVMESYVDYDLTGEEPTLRSRVSIEAVHGDAKDMLEGPDLPNAWRRLDGDAVFLRAERGMLNEEQPLYPDPAPIAERMPVRTVENTNHYTILFGESGARAVAQATAQPDITS